jgi:hypothetical protein
MKLPEGALYIENTQIWEDISCNLTAHTSISWSVQYVSIFTMVKFSYV